MTIEKMNDREGDRNDYLVTCNEADCKASLDAKDRTFTQAVTFIKAKGWRITKFFGSWHHYCPQHKKG